MIWLFTFIFLILIVAMMAIGVILSKQPIAGSCGGLNKLGLKEDCPICGDQSKKSIIQTDRNDAPLYYDAAQRPYTEKSKK